MVLIFFDEDGNTVLSDTTADYHDYLKCINDMYREGFFPEEDLAITNEDDAKQLALNGKCFMYEWCARPTHLDQLNTSTSRIFRKQSGFRWLRCWMIPRDWFGAMPVGQAYLSPRTAKIRKQLSR